MSSSKSSIDELTERPNDRFGRFLYDIAYIWAILGGLFLVIVILINFVSILSRIIFLNPLVGDFELVEIGSAIAISSFLPHQLFNNRKAAITQRKRLDSVNHSDNHHYRRHRRQRRHRTTDRPPGKRGSPNPRGASSSSRTNSH